MTIKNFRHGRLWVVDGSTPIPLAQIVNFSEDTFNWNEPRERNLVRNRGEIVENTVGDDQPIAWSFEAKYEDRSSLRLVRDGVFTGVTEQVTGLTAAALNLNVATTYDFEQGTLVIDPADAIAPGTKLGIAVAPAVAGEFSENLGAENVEKVVVVPAATSFNIFMPAADTDVNVIYDGVGKSTLNVAGLAAGACTGSVNYFDLRLDIYDPCFPPSVKDLTVGTVVEQQLVPQCYLTEDGFNEDSEADVLSFSGEALGPKVLITPVP